jgi:hypothetical protein
LVFSSNILGDALRVKLENLHFYLRDRGDKEGLVLGGLCGEIWLSRNEDSKP